MQKQKGCASPRRPGDDRSRQQQRLQQIQQRGLKEQRGAGGFVMEHEGGNILFCL